MAATKPQKRKKKPREQPASEPELLRKVRDSCYGAAIAEMGKAATDARASKEIDLQLLRATSIVANLLTALECGHQMGDYKCVREIDNIACFGFGTLLSLVKRLGSKDVATLLSKRLVQLIEDFLRVCYAKPELFHPNAEQQTIWPGLITRERHYNEYLESIRKRIRLGEKTGLNYEGKLGRQLGSQIARKLFGIIENARKPPSFVEDMPPEMRKRYDEAEAAIQKNLPKLVLGESPIDTLLRINNELSPKNIVITSWPFGLFSPNEARVFRGWSKSLPMLNRSSDVLEKWWKVVKALFVKAYGRQFEDWEEFARYWKEAESLSLSRGHAAKYAKDYQRRNEVRRRILNDIRQGLKSIAAKPGDVHFGKI